METKAHVKEQNGIDYRASDEEKGHNNGSILEKPRSTANHDDPFGNDDGEVQYRTMAWWQAALIMIAETVSLGILSLPSAIAGIGMVPGVILIIGLGIIATYTGYTIGQFKAAYPFVHNMADAGEVLLGPVGREVFGIAQTIFLTFVMGSHLLTFGLAMNAITGHATCSIVWGLVGMLILFVVAIPRTLKQVSYFSIAAFASIVAAVFITMVALGVSPPNPVVHATVSTTFNSAFASVLNIVFAYAGHVAFFSFISELKDPKDFPKALGALQIADSSMYLVIAVVIYRYAGPDVASPALGSTGSIVRKVAYGVALPTILLAGVIYGHVNTKYVYVRIFRGTKHIAERSRFATGTWIGIALALWIIAWIIAESIPVFNDLVGLISALFAANFTYTLSGVFWLFINAGKWFSNWRKISLTIVNLFIVALGLTVCGVGLYSSGKAIHEHSVQGAGKAWNCET
ncbi:Hypothetical protein R9X50_00063000 [Acrodontium crateriforme]|uniref:Amino acid transporter transmembrane domain-containing protein n=1 Tax=Acrodontium crateriforme TaxID=150365 RepID=A0AAQ3LXV6_9PEZI|nr:Hypothetical protein R9X50_00063000 [Acrodontium crateriforme]